MGLILAPFLSVQTFLWEVEIIQGDQFDKNNPLRWDVVRQNLPGSAEYDPIIAWMRKFDNLRQQVANDILTYYDNVRLTGGDKPQCVNVM
eukprot:15191225-Ditylum_brightwellii.AAC.1